MYVYIVIYINTLKKIQAEKHPQNIIKCCLPCLVLSLLMQTLQKARHNQVEGCFFLYKKKANDSPGGEMELEGTCWYFSSKYDCKDFWPKPLFAVCCKEKPRLSIVKKNHSRVFLLMEKAQHDCKDAMSSMRARSITPARSQSTRRRAALLMHQHREAVLPFAVWDGASSKWITASHRKALGKANPANFVLFSQTSLHTAQAQRLHRRGQDLRGWVHPADPGHPRGGGRGASCSTSLSRYGHVCTAKGFWNVIFPAGALWVWRMRQVLAMKDWPGSAPPQWLMLLVSGVFIREFQTGLDWKGP